MTLLVIFVLFEDVDPSDNLSNRICMFFGVPEEDRWAPHPKPVSNL